MTGIDDPYEPPADPEVIVRPGELDDQVRKILARLEDLQG